MPKPEGFTEEQGKKRDEIAQALLRDPTFIGRGTMERRQRAYAIATAQVGKGIGLQSNPVSREEQDTLGLLVDKHGIGEILRALEEIAYEKSAHVLEAWQDRELARVWHRIGGALNNAASDAEGSAV